MVKNTVNDMVDDVRADSFVIIEDDDDLTVDNKKLIEQRKEYLEESKSQESND